MGHSPEVLLLDDGELDDVQAILDDCGISYGRVRGGAIVPNTPAPRRLLVTTPRRVEAVQFPETENDELVRIVMVDEDSPTLRSQLRAEGFDYLVRRPVHREALRLLLLHCIYQGEERRGEPRVPVGLQVSFRTGILPRRAVLADLSTRGCRLLSRWAIEPGKRIRVTLPSKSGLGEAITLRGEVLRMGLDEGIGPDGPYSAAVAFESVEPEARKELEWLLAERSRGPATLPPDGHATSDEPVLDAPETRDEHGMAHGVSVEVDVRMDATASGEPTEAETAPLDDDAPETRLLERPRTSEAEADDGAAESAPHPEPVSEDAAASAGAPVDDRRRARRGAYPMRVPAFGDRAMRVLVARDLSVGGMRFEKESSLEVGDRLHLAIYGAADEEPILVWGTLERDDRDEGMAMVFDELHPTIGQQLEKIVANLPAVESLHDDEACAMGTVVTEILQS